MEVERTIEFLVKNQARVDARIESHFDKALALAGERLTETEDKLNGLIDPMDRRIRGNGQQG